MVPGSLLDPHHQERDLRPRAGPQSGRRTGHRLVFRSKEYLCAGAGHIPLALRVDETFIGSETSGSPPGRGSTKETVLGLVEQRAHKMGPARFHPLPDASGLVLETIIREEVRPGATIRTDGGIGHNNIAGYNHVAKKRIKTKEGRDLPAVHLLFSNLKRLIKGVHTHVSPQKRQKNLDLFEYRYKWRDDLFGEFYFAAILIPLTGPRRYQELKATATAL